MSFVHLNVHSHYSFLEALGTPKSIVKTAKSLGYSSIALTDTHHLYGAIEFYKAAKDEGIKAIIGCELIYVEDFKDDETKTSGKITLLAKSYEGYQNLLKLSSYAAIEGQSQTPRIDSKSLENHSAGLILLTGDFQGYLAKLILTGKTSEADNFIGKFTKVFQNDFYIEIQRHRLMQDCSTIESELINLAKKHQIKLVATHGTRYIKSEDNISHDILLCIGRQTNINDSSRYKYIGDFSILPPEQMKEIFSDIPEAIENTVKISDACDLKLNFGQNLIPRFKTPEGKTSKEYLRELCFKGMEELYPENEKSKAAAQLEYELEMVDKMGFNDYFLIVWDFINYARTNGIAVGPGRGSAAGAIIAYTLHITELDPLKYGLIFERFLNPARVSMPDIDIDFSDLRRDEVLKYTIEKYGRDCVSQVITYGTMTAKAVVRDVGRGMGYPYSEVDLIAKAVPMPVLGKHSPLSISVLKDPELSQIYQNDPRAKALLDNAIKIEGTVRQAGTHACAVIVSETPLVNYTPLQKATDGSEGIITQFSMKYLEDIGLLKMDFLGLKNLTLIDSTIERVKKSQNISVNISKIPMDDQKTFELFQRGDTTGIFQLESNGMRRYIRELKPTDFEDIIAMISLYRPGPMEWIPVYIQGKHQPETIKYQDPAFEEILSKTNGVAIYQEQILLIAQKFAGFTLGEADILRRAVGKKDPKLLEEQKNKFIDGAVKLGHTQKHGKDIFEKVVEPFAGYGFNKSHAACYAMISYRTAYLKAHFPTEFMAALLTNEMGDTEKIASEISDCHSMGIEVLPPSINESEADFTQVGEKQIRFGLSAIKGVGEGPISEIIKIRKEKGKFKTTEELAANLPPKLLNKKTIESLAYSGALDEVGNRETIAENFETISKFAKESQKSINENSDQTDLFGESTEHELGKKTLTLKKVAPISQMEKLNLEKKYLGLYASGHPLKGLSSYLRRKAKPISSITQKHVGKIIKIAGLLTSLKTSITKSQTAMAFGEIEDLTGKLPFVVFPKVYEEYKFKLSKDQIVIAEGKLEERRGLQLSIFSIKTVSLDTMIKNAKEENVYGNESDLGEGAVKFENDILEITIPETISDDSVNELKKLLKNSPGENPVILNYTDLGTQKSIKLKNTINFSENLKKSIEKILN